LGRYERKWLDVGDPLKALGHLWLTGQLQREVSASRVWAARGRARIARM
jgi:hypothetical protein